MVLYYIAKTLVLMVPYLPIAIVLRALAALWRRRAGTRTTPWHEAGAALLVLWAGTVLSQTVSLGDLLAGRLGGGISLRPLASLGILVDNLRYHGVGYLDVFLVNVLGNIGVFVPLGLLPPLLWKPWERGLVTAAAGLGFSLLIETAQLFNHRITDVDDLLLNTLGAVIGWLLWRLLRRLAPRWCGRLRVRPGAEGQPPCIRGRKEI